MNMILEKYPEIINYNKLVRDKIPEIIQADHKKPFVHTASEPEYWTKLLEKLKEEVSEFSAKDSNILDELADILEVVNAICDFKGITLPELEKIRQEKALKRGAFKKRIILEKVEG